jgi:Glyoxalase-like domain
MPSSISRRRFLALSAFALAAPYAQAAVAYKMSSVPADLDHMLLGVSDLDHGISWMEERSGVRAAVGGVHPGRGTRNALLSLGPHRYLEIIAPDPQQAGASANQELPSRLRALKEPTLIGWAAHTVDLDALVQKAAAAGIAAQAPRNGSRARPDGKTLRWTSFSLNNDYRGLLPFFIEWAPESVHPSQDAPSGCTLLTFSAESPEAKEVSGVAARLGLDIEVKAGKQAGLHARIAGKKGEFELA